MPRHPQRNEIDLQARIDALESVNAALEARLAVPGRVEEMLRADLDRKVELGSSSTRGFYASDESHCDADFVCYYGATLLDALAALVDAPAVEAKGGE